MSEVSKSLDLTRARELLVRARAQPAEVLSEGRALLQRGSDPRLRSVALRAMSIAARVASTTQESIELARQAAAEAEAADHRELRSEALGTLAGSLTIGGDFNEAVDVLDKATEGAEGRLLAQLTFQRGAIMANQGYVEEALEALDHALPLFRQIGDEEFEALTLGRKGSLEIEKGQLEQAERDLQAGRDINDRLGLVVEVASMDQNLGRLAAYRGDVPRALDLLTSSDRSFMELSGDDAPQHIFRCETLITAGLYNEAYRSAHEIALHNRRQRDRDHEAQAWLVAARAAFLAGDVDEAVEMGSTAAGMFAAQSQEVLHLQARQLLVAARHRVEGATEPLAGEARAIAGQLDERGFVVHAAEASLLAGRISVELNSRQAVSDLERVASIRAGPVELRLQSRLARALLRRHQGDQRGAASSARAGLVMLDEYQASLGASDLRAGIESWGRELGQLGLELAIESRRPRRVFEWMERSRARALIHPPVLPSGDEKERGALAELRRLEADLRQGSTPDQSLLRRRRALHETIKELDRSRRGHKTETLRARPHDVIEILQDSELVEFAEVGGRLWAVHVRHGRFRLLELGEMHHVANETQHLRFQMRKTARRGGGDHQLRESLGRLGEMLFGSIRISGRSLVVVPTPEMMAIPWSGLPGLVDLDLIVAPSATVWVRAEGSRARPGHVVLTAGPDLEQSHAEIESLNRIYDRATTFDPERSVVEDVTKAITGARLAHAACHAHFEADNPMFSSLRLADGDLNVYDIERLGLAPSMMVLSACDSGFTETRAGEELSGLTAALLRMGSKTVVASVGLVPDTEATRELMVAFHRALIGGEPPARALRIARQSVLEMPGGFIAAASFVCVGSG